MPEITKIESLLEENEKEITKVEQDLSNQKKTIVDMEQGNKWILLLIQRGDLYKERCRLLAQLIKE